MLESAIANAEHTDGADIDDLKVKTIFAQQGTTAQAFHRIQKCCGANHCSNAAVVDGDTAEAQQISFQYRCRFAVKLHAWSNHRTLPGDAGRPTVVLDVVHNPLKSRRSPTRTWPAWEVSETGQIGMPSQRRRGRRGTPLVRSTDHWLVLDTTIIKAGPFEQGIRIMDSKIWNCWL